MVFLSFRSRNLALDGEGYTVGAWHSQAGGITSDLVTTNQQKTWNGDGPGKHWPFVHGTSVARLMISIDRGAEVLRISKELLLPAFFNEKTIIPRTLLMHVAYS